MNISTAASEVFNWTSNNLGSPLGIVAVFAAAGAIAFIGMRDHFTHPTMIAFNDPSISAAHARTAELYKRLGISYSEPN